MTLEQKDDLAFAKSFLQVGSASETAQWDLTVKGSKASGTWNILAEDNDKTVHQKGTITTTLNENTLKFEMIEDEPVITLKPNVKPYEIPMVKGAKWLGTLTRKKKE